MKRGQLIIGCLPSVGAYILPDALTIFKEQFPNIDLVLVEEAKGKLIDLTLRGQTDISLLSLPIEDSRLEILPLSNEEIVLAVPKNHIFSNKTMITLSECKNESFILLKKGQGFRRIFEELCEEAGYEPKVSQESNNMETLKSLVAAGLGISLMPKMYSKLNWKSSSLVYIPIQGLPPYKLVFSYKKGRFISKITTSFISIMNSIMDKDTFQEDK